MTAARRWCVVALGVAILVSLPFAIAALPARDSALSAQQLLTAVQKSSGVSYSGLAESAGSLQLPVSDQFTDVANLLGEKATLRVWWRAEDDWRVNQLTPTGETDVIREFSGTTTWEFEANKVTWSPLADMRLPQTSDLLPPTLARRLLEDARTDEVTRLPADRVAGIDAPGIRLDPANVQSSIDHVDVWVHEDSGLPVRVDVYGLGSEAPDLSTTFTTLSLERPDASETAFSSPPGTDVETDEFVDVVAATDHYAPVRPPRRLAGLSQRQHSPGAVGVYGRGATVLVALPLWDNAADPLREQLAKTPGTTITRRRSSLGVGPLNLALTSSAFEEYSWLVVGTVTPQTLIRASHQLLTSLPHGRWFAAGRGQR